MTRRALELVSPGVARIVEEPIPNPGTGEVSLRAIAGAISVGSETLVAGGHAGDSNDSALSGGGRYPLRYGYTLVGAASDPDERTAGERAAPPVFCFHPHATHAVVPLDATLAIPESVPAEVATLYPNTETALTLLWDGAPRLGEAVAVFGAGLVGILVGMLAARSGPGLVVVIEPDADRRRWAAAALADGATVVADPGEARAVLERCAGAARHPLFPGFDLVYELTGNPAALSDAVGLATFDGRVVVGSWYGERRHPVALDDRFHRARITIRSSQVSTIAPEASGRLSRARRTAIVWHLLATLPVGRIARRDIAFGEVAAVLTRLAGGERLEPWLMIDYRRDTR